MSYIGSNYAQQVTTPAVDYFNGNGVTTTFQLSRAVTSVFAIQVVVNNVPQNAREAYGITSSNQIVFTSAPSAGTNNIYVVYDSQVGQTVTPSPGTVTASALTANAVTTNAIAPGAVTTIGLDVGRLDGTGAIIMPSGTTAQRPVSPVVGMQRWNTTLSTMEVYVGGGTGWQTIASTAYSIEYLVIGGGGGGGSGNGPPSAAGGGGGAGGYRSSVAGEGSGGNSATESPIVVNPGTSIGIVIGAGGVGRNDLSGTNGSNSSFGSIVSLGGGGGGCGSQASGAPGSGGSGGGHDYLSGAAGTAGQGFAGGNGRANGGSDYYGGGGGGAGAVGQSSTLGLNGAGGAGLSSAITGTGVFRAGGGGSGKYQSNNGAPAAAGGSGGGGNGGDQNGTGGSAGTVNTGGGGGGGPRNVPFSGGSGVVIIRYAGAQRGTGGSVTANGGYTIHTFTASGSFTA